MSFLFLHIQNSNPRRICINANAIEAIVEAHSTQAVPGTGCSVNMSANYYDGEGSEPVSYMVTESYEAVITMLMAVTGESRPHNQKESKT